jgi:type II secretory pathway component GspD/PulD (secretin)
MASKKGIVVTVIILAVITGASFVFWIVPQDSESTFVVSDYEGYIDGVKNIHEVLQESINIEYQNLHNGDISTSDYISVADITSSQVTAQISEFVTSKPPQEWQESYIRYMEALKKFNEYIVETKVAANLIEKESFEEEMAETIQKIESLKEESKQLVKKSDKLRPN